MSAPAALKKKMGYTEEPVVKCQNCAHMVETDGVLDRSWDQTCTLNPACNFTVKNHGRCKHHTPKKKSK